MSRASARGRFASVILVAMWTVIITASLAGAHGGDTDKVHACVVQTSGYLRIIDADETCKKGEAALDWTRRAGGTYTAGSGLALSADNEFSVTGAPWSGLTGVPSGFADGTDDDGTGQVTALRQALDGDGLDTTPNESNDLVSFFEIKDLTTGTGVNEDGRITGNFIRDGSITAADLAGGPDVSGAVTSMKIFDGTIESADLGSNAVTTDAISNGTIATSDLASGAITTDKQTSNASVGTNPGSTTLAPGLNPPIVSTSMTLGGARHNVLLTGQATLDCTGCPAPISVMYTLGEAGSPMVGSPVMTATVDSAHGDIVLPISWLVQANGGPHTFDLLVTMPSSFVTGPAVVKSATLNAVDLGLVSTSP